MNRYQASLKEKGILFLIAWLFCIALPGYSGTSGFQEYLIPGQEALLRSHYVYLDNDPAVGNTMHCVISVTASTDGTIINYDHWENGYGTPDETYTLNTGQYKVFESGNIPANPRGTSTYYDGGDRITVIGGPAFVSRASWPEDPGTVMALAFEILPIQALSNAFEMPVGSDLYQNDRSEPFADFERVVLMVQSTRDNNAVTIYGPDNAVIYSGTLNKGQSAVDTDLRNVRKGTRVTATWPVQIQFLTALEVDGTSSQINGFTGLPTALWGRRYAVPVTSFLPRSSTPASRTDLYLYNPNSQPITVTYRDSTTGSFTIAAKQLASFALKTGHYVPRNYGVDLTGSSTFWGFGIAGTGYDSWDWGLIFIPKEYCRTQYVVGWAPGDLNKTNNYSAVFVMPFRNSSTIFVDYDQNGTVDNTYTASRPQVVRIVDPNDRDMTGARIWSPDTLAMNYGEISGDPTVTGSPALDLGYTLIPLAEQFVDQVLSIEKGVNIDTVVVGHPAEFTLTVTTYSYLVGSIKVRDFMPPGWDYVTGSAVVSFSNGNPPQQVEPAQSGTVAAGLTLFWDLNYTLNPNQTITIAFSIYPTATAAAGVTENCAEVQGTNSGNTFTADGCGFIYNQPAGDIGDQVWNDLNRNGLQDAGEPGLPNVTVAIYTAGGTLAGSTVTDSDGRYLFAELLPGDYYLQFTAPAGYALSAVDQGGDDGLDSDADPATGRTAATTLTSGEIDLGWDAGLYILVPDIHLEKSTNGMDADLPAGPSVPVGDAVTWSYTVTNPGDVPLSGVTVTDNQSGVQPEYLSGDDGDNLLEPGEIWIFQAAGVAAAGQYQNIGTAFGRYNGQSVSDTDPSHYFGEWPRASLSDYVWNDLNRNGLQDPGEPGLADVSVALFTIDGLPAGMVMTNSDGRYLFENLVPGGYYLIFSTPAGYGFTSADAGDDNLDSDPDPVTGRTSTITLAPGANDASQDAGLYALVPALRLEKVINGEDADLPAGPSVPVGGTVTWNYQVSNPGDVALAEIQVTDSDASVTPVYQSGDDGNSLLDPGETWIYSATATAVPGQYQNVGTATGRYQEQTLTASDPAHYFGGQAAIGIKKSTNGEDANEQPGPYITPGEAVTWSYLITNLGNVAISNLLVTDSESSVTPAYLSGDDGDGMLNPGESWLYQASGTALAGQYGNVGSVYGTDIFGQPVTASDASHYFGPSPSLRIKKMTNGEDADLPIGPAIPAGQPVLWSYVVTNTGNIHLANVTVTDDQGLTPQAVDIAPADGYNDGDLDLDHLLDLEEIWTYTASGLAVAGQYANTGTVTAEFNGQMVNSSDPSHYFGGQGAIEIEKSTNGLDADSEPGPAILAGAPVEWRYRVRNIGNTPVRDLAVSDDRGVTPAAVDIAPADGFNDGDTDLDGLLDTSEIWEFIASGTALAGQYANVGSVTGLDALTSLPLSDEDPSHYFGAVPAIAIEKLTNGEDADSEPGPAIILDGTVTWRYVVTNTGNVPLDSITVVDSDTSVHPLLIFGDLDSDQKLDLDETWIFEASAAARAGQYANIGTASGRFNGTAFQASDPSHYYCEGRMDFGDARDPSYPTLLASDGARHILSDLYLGALIDTENDGIVSANNTGDDLAASDDEDGILFPSLPFIQNSQNEVMVISSGAGFLNAWIDFNRDGDWMDAGEKILSDQPVAAGSESLLFQVPDIDPDAAPEIRAMNARFRLSSQPGIGFSGMALDGEVEDYEVAIYVPVELSSFTATAAGGAVELAWTTQSETENLGFSLYRSAAAEGPFERITGQIIPGAGSSTAAHSYRYKDITVAPGLNYWYRLADISLDGAMHMHKAVQVTVQPAEYSLEQNYPNPFNPVTTIRFSLREAGEVSLTVVNMQGQVVRTLVAARMEAGIHELRWDAKNEAGIPMPSGSYLCILKANGFNKTMQMTLLK